MEAVYTEEQIRAVEADNPNKALYMRHTMRGEVEAERLQEGERLLKELLNDPAFAEANRAVYELWRREMGAKGQKAPPTLAMRMAVNQMKHDRISDLHAAEQKVLIDMALKREKEKKGLFR